MRPALVVLPLLAVVSLAGCADNAELKKARAEAEEAKAELTKVKVELDQLKAQRASDQSEEDKVMGVGKEFIELLRANRSDKAYQLASASFQKQMFPQGLPGAAELRAADLLAQKPAIKNLEQVQYRQHKLEKSSDDKGYELICSALEFLPRNMQAARDAYAANGVTGPGSEKGAGPWVEITLTIIQEGGTWKVDRVHMDTQEP